MKNLVLIITVFTVILLSGFFPISVSALADSGRDTFSFRFENTTVSDALREISKKSGINIISNSIIKKQILSKSYTDKRLDKIISDLLRGENSAVVWNYNNGSLDSIGVYIPEEDKNQGKTSGPGRISRSAGNRPSVARSTPNINPGRPNSSFNDLGSSREENNRIIRSNRINNNLPNYPTSDNKNISKRVNTQRRTVSGRSSSTTTNTNNRRSTNNKTDSRSEEEEEKDTPEENTPPEIPEPDTEEYHGLEPPPMPPGL